MSECKGERGSGVAHTPTDCEAAIGSSFLLSGYRQDGERVCCPGCGNRWVHVCDEAEGCRWVKEVDP